MTADSRQILNAAFTTESDSIEIVNVENQPSWMKKLKKQLDIEFG